MCGRFAMNEEVDELIKEYVASGGDYRDRRPSYSLAPTDPALIVRERTDQGTGELRRTVDEAAWTPVVGAVPCI